MIIPPYLKPGDTIGIVATARKISMEEIQFAIQWIEKCGYKTFLAPHLFAEENQFAGNDTLRCHSMQTLINDPKIRAILCARGGYGSARIIDQIDFTPLQKYPKWLCGYSDFTVFHSHLASQQISASIHTTMPISMNEKTIESCQSLTDTLSGKKMQLQGPPCTFNKPGCAQGPIIGGNLSILYSLLASPSDLNTDNAILFIEDLDEYLYHIDRMIVAYKRAGKFKNLAGLIIGGMSDMHDNTIPFGHTAQEIIAEHCSEYNFPIAFNLPIGHTHKNLSLKFGISSSLEVTPNGWSLQEL